MIKNLGNAAGGGGGGVAISAAATSFSTGTVVFSNSNGVFFGLSNNNVLTASVAGAANPVFSAGAASASLGSVIFSNANGVSFGLNGSTITGSVASPIGATLSYFEPPVVGIWATENRAVGYAYMRPFVADNNVSAMRLQFLQAAPAALTSTMQISASISGGAAASASGTFGVSGSVAMFSRQSTGTNANSSNLAPYFSNTYSYAIGMSDSVSWSTALGSATVSWTTSGAITYISRIDSNGIASTGSYGSSGSSTFSSVGAAGTFSTSIGASFASQVFSGTRPILVPWGTSFSAGEYWIAHISQFSTGSTNDTLQNVCAGTGAQIVYQPTALVFNELGSSVSNSISFLQQGFGYISSTATSNSTTTFGVNLYNNQSYQQWWFNMMAASK